MGSDDEGRAGASDAAETLENRPDSASGEGVHHETSKGDPMVTKEGSDNDGGVEVVDVEEQPATPAERITETELAHEAGDGRVDARIDSSAGVEAEAAQSSVAGGETELDPIGDGVSVPSPPGEASDGHTEGIPPAAKETTKKEGSAAALEHMETSLVGDGQKGVEMEAPTGGIAAAMEDATTIDAALPDEANSVDAVVRMPLAVGGEDEVDSTGAALMEPVAMHDTASLVVEPETSTDSRLSTDVVSTEAAAEQEQDKSSQQPQEPQEMVLGDETTLADDGIGATEGPTSGTLAREATGIAVDESAKTEPGSTDIPVLDHAEQSDSAVQATDDKSGPAPATVDAPIPAAAEAPISSEAVQAPVLAQAVEPSDPAAQNAHASEGIQASGMSEPVEAPKVDPVVLAEKPSDSAPEPELTASADDVQMTAQATDSTKPSSTVSAPFADVKGSLTAAPLSPGKAATAQQADEPVMKQIALVLKINKELIRLCVDLQGKELASDGLFKDAALRLQSNLAFLASIADRSTKAASSVNESPVAPLNDEPFLPTLHSPDSLLPKLYQLLRSLGKPVEGQQGGTKRPRIDSHEGPGQKAKEQQPSGESTATSTLQRLPSTQLQGQTTLPVAPSSSVTPPTRTGSESNGVAPAAPSSNGSLGNPQQIQNLTQAFGPNAVMNLNALQAHYRGQPQAVVSYMEANMPGFRTLPIQMQLQQMTNVQNAAMQRQHQQSLGGSPPSNHAQQQQQHFQQQSHLRRSSAAQSPSADSPTSRLAGRSTQSPMPAGTTSPGSLLQQQGRPGTPVSQNPFAHLGSPALSNASPASHLMPTPTGMSFPSPQNGTFATSGASQSMPPMLANAPAHIQQQYLQQLQLHMQQQQQQQQNNAFTLSQNQTGASGVWPPQQQPPPSS